jgi:Domain of unknown function (DUF4160)
MPTIKRFDRCRIEMYFDDHPPPHFHVIAGNDAAVYLIATLELRDGELRPRDAAEALEWAANNRAELFARWQEYCEEEP